MKYLAVVLLFIATTKSNGQSPFNNTPLHLEFNTGQFQKNYHAATVVEMSGVAIAFTGAALAEEASGKTAFAIFGSSLALGGWVYSLLSSNRKVVPAQRYNRRATFASRKEGNGVKFKF